ncbi:MAG TPA: response regulator [Spirochaetota bacterium]|nr:response regulator [Spirochaetota bacterium]
MGTVSDNENIYKKPPPGIRPDGKSYRAIIVDDSRAARQILKQILLSVKFDVIEEIDNGGAAVEKLKNQNLRVDYLFVDVEMPVLNGVEVVKTVRGALPDCKIVMVTSHSEREKIEELIKLGINGYIKKPFDRDTVIFKLSGLR